MCCCAISSCIQAVLLLARCLPLCSVKMGAGSIGVCHASAAVPFQAVCRPGRCLQGVCCRAALSWVQATQAPARCPPLCSVRMGAASIGTGGASVAEQVMISQGHPLLSMLSNCYCNDECAVPAATWSSVPQAQREASSSRWRPTTSTIRQALLGQDVSFAGAVAAVPMELAWCRVLLVACTGKTLWLHTCLTGISLPYWRRHATQRKLL